ncbi:MAG: anhydro-N-acetylmuramic acid kinase [Propylenella sp.]
MRTAIGLMSGTSLDGVDVALIRTDGERIAELGPARTYSYSEADRLVLRQATKDALTLKDRVARPGVLGDAEALVTRRHAEAVEAFIAAEGVAAADIDLVGFHGQTVFHDPARRLTVQIGDGQALADRLSVPVAWDMRADDVAAGGQGAPLAPIFHRALADRAGLQGPVVFLNLGGVANVTYVGADGELLAFDTGPGNGLLDDWMLARTGRPFDADGRLAAAGKASQPVLDGLLAHRYFDLPPPKSLDRNAFSTAALAGLSDADGAATLLRFSAHAVKAATAHLPAPPRAWFASGGGRRNPAMMHALAEVLAGAPLHQLEALGFDGDATEAQAFAFLGVRAADRKPLTFPMTTGVPAPMTGGRLSIPKNSG